MKVLLKLDYFSLFNELLLMIIRRVSPINPLILLGSYPGKSCTKPHDLKLESLVECCSIVNHHVIKHHHVRNIGQGRLATGATMELRP